MNTLSSTNLNDYDFLALFGMQKADEKQKLRINDQLNNLVWEEFLLERLEEELGEQGIEEVNHMVEENRTIEELIDFIIKKVPNLKNILGNILIKAKKELIKQYIQLMLEGAEKDKYLKAQELFEKEKWSELSKLMA